MSQSARLLELLRSKLGSQLLESELVSNEAVVRISSLQVGDFFRILKLDTEFSFNLLLDISAVDWMDAKTERFELVYHLLSLSRQHRLRVKVWIPENKPEVQSLVSLWSGANFLEREVWDMFGINFKDHPDLRRILMYDEFVGHPLRKDYPVQGKQPRIPLRYPEVENTARQMLRPALVQINKKEAAQKNSEQPAQASHHRIGG